MKTSLRHFFIPHEGNNYHPHILHSKRAVLYSLLMLLVKAIVVLFVVLVPTEAFLLPDVLKNQQDEIITLTNEVREQKGLPKLTGINALDRSSTARATDMSENSYFSHKGPNGHTLSYFLKKSGYSYRVAGENLAMGFSDPQSVVNAWLKSPTHYANLVDSDYTQIGIGVEAGYFNGQPTVYVAQHFGDPRKKAAVVIPPAATSTVKASAATKNTTATLVRGEKISEPVAGATSTDPLPLIDKAKSRVYWFDRGDKTLIVVRAYARVPAERLVAYVNFYPIELESIGTSTSYAGELEIQESAHELFDPVITPTITITTKEGTQVNESIEWFEPKIVVATPVEKYFQAKKILNPVTSLFTVTKGIYLGFLALFIVALGINIFVEVRKQHYHVIFQTVALIGFILLLWYF